MIELISVQLFNIEYDTTSIRMSLVAVVATLVPDLPSSVCTLKT